MDGPTMGELSVAGLEQGDSVWMSAPMDEPTMAGLEQGDSVWMSAPMDELSMVGPEQGDAVWTSWARMGLASYVRRVLWAPIDGRPWIC